MPFSTIDQALDQLRKGRPVLALDDGNRENEGDVILPAEFATTEWLAWMIRHTSGYLCAPMTNAWADRLGLPLMVEHNSDRLRTAYTISCDAAHSVTTGISAADRATTLRTLADPNSVPDSVIRPGHILPLRARDGGVFERDGHTEATVDLCRLAGLNPVGAIGELVCDDGQMMRTEQVLECGKTFDLAVITIEELQKYRQRYDRVERIASAALPTKHGQFEIIGYRDLRNSAGHIALVAGEINSHALVRVHSECLTGDAFASLRCDCGQQLDQAMAEVAKNGGVVIYLRGHEGRGVGLLSKLEAYSLQDEGADTVDAQKLLGMPVDAREYGAAAAILTELGISSVELLTNNPEKTHGLTELGIKVTGTRRLITAPNPYNLDYLRTKRDRMGHLFPTEEAKED